MIGQPSSMPSGSAQESAYQNLINNLIKHPRYSYNDRRLQGVNCLSNSYLGSFNFSVPWNGLKLALTVISKISQTEGAEFSKKYATQPKEGFPRPKGDRNVMVYLHTHKGCRQEGLYLLDALDKYRASLCVFDFAGAGQSEGEYTSFGHFESDQVNTVVGFLTQQLKFESVGLWGKSMGAAATILAQGRQMNPSIKFLVIDSSFDTLKHAILNIAKEHSKAPQFAIKTFLLFVSNTVKSKAGFDIEKVRPIDAVGSIQVPTLFVTGEEDSIVSKSEFFKLFSACSSKHKKILICPGDHADNRLEDPNFEKMVTTFMGHFFPKDKSSHSKNSNYLSVDPSGSKRKGSSHSNSSDRSKKRKNSGGVLKNKVAKQPAANNTDNFTNMLAGQIGQFIDGNQLPNSMITQKNNYRKKSFEKGDVAQTGQGGPTMQRMQTMDSVPNKIAQPVVNKLSLGRGNNPNNPNVVANPVPPPQGSYSVPTTPAHRAPTNHQPVQPAPQSIPSQQAPPQAQIYQRPTNKLMQFSQFGQYMQQAQQAQNPKPMYDGTESISDLGAPLTFESMIGNVGQHIQRNVPQAGSNGQGFVNKQSKNQGYAPISASLANFQGGQEQAPYQPILGKKKSASQSLSNSSGNFGGGHPTPDLAHQNYMNQKMNYHHSTAGPSQAQPNHHFHQRPMFPSPALPHNHNHNQQAPVSAYPQQSLADSLSQSKPHLHSHHPKYHPTTHQPKYQASPPGPSLPVADSMVGLFQQ